MPPSVPERKETPSPVGAGEGVKVLGGESRRDVSERNMALQSVAVKDGRYNVKRVGRTLVAGRAFL